MFLCLAEEFNAARPEFPWQDIGRVTAFEVSLLGVLLPLPRSGLPGLHPRPLSFFSAPTTNSFRVKSANCRCRNNLATTAPGSPATASNAGAPRKIEPQRQQPA
jgi:hypothetical protein